MVRRDRYSKTHQRGNIEIAMLEKYFHSKGACLFEEGNFDEAIKFFRKAIEIEDQPYTRYHLGLAHLKKDEVREAIVELSRAIELNPDVPEYYFERSHAFRRMEESLNAQKDEGKTIELDNNFARIDIIKATLQAIKDALSGPAWLDEVSESGIKDLRLRKIFGCLREVLHERRGVLENASCLLPCPSYCCHFTGETILHGVYIGPWKLHAVRKFLREKGLPENEFLGRMPYHEEQHLQELIPPQFIVSEKGEQWIYYPLRQKSTLRALLRDLPKGKDYQTILWINEKARACVFLQGGRCIIHDTGGEPGLPSCKEFLCLTGFVFVVLKWLGLMDESEIASRNIRELNKIAIESVLILASELYGHNSVIKHGSMIDDLLKKAIEADRSDNTRVMNELMREYDSSMDSYEKVVSERKEGLRTAVALLFKR
jgi:tetratricopeptide (TPR) repeat protein